MTKNYVLVDFENVQPKNLDLLRDHPFEVLVFVGANQSKLPFDLATAMQTLGESGRYIKIAGNGSNALDFHIAYYIGELAAADPKASFTIISRDKGFDPLLKHLKSRKYQVARLRDLAELPQLQVSNAVSEDEKVKVIAKNLKARGQSRPRKVNTLKNTINSLFREKIPDDELDALIEDLQRRKVLQVKNGNISYRLGEKK